MNDMFGILEKWNVGRMWRKKDEKIKRIEDWNIGNYNNAGNGGEARAVPEQCERRRSARALLGHWSGFARLLPRCQGKLFQIVEYKRTTIAV